MAKGWYGESERHGLSARGIKSGRTPRKQIKTSRSPKKRYVKVYHGTSRDNAEGIMKKGLKDPYVSTSIFSANWFGQHKGKPVVMEVEVPEDKVYWADVDGNVIKKADVRKIRDELEEREDDQYLLVKGDVEPENIEKMSDSKRIQTVVAEEKKWNKYWDER